MGEWIDLLAFADLADGEVTPVVTKSGEVALYRVGNEIFATDNTCTHGQARLCDGFLEGYEIECPLHQGRFDIRTGEARCPPVERDIRAYETQVKTGRVLIKIE